ncbi:hypothetical protein UFOVP157_32 [uncultured Caudovirales phage]|uniref:Uncharacterized protein n=1 Tax=uncultured Caudovirales phage TaxID=2100421 RepID=A0A6J7W965_9CAUD|nr:hypothetical protein UFOVP157_32 [uncultured Caudovirales phage]
MKKPQELKTYFVTATIEVVYECYARSEQEATERFEDSMADADQRSDITENGVAEIIKIEDADTHFTNHD